MVLHLDAVFLEARPGGTVARENVMSRQCAPRLKLNLVLLLAVAQPDQTSTVVGRICGIVIDANSARGNNQTPPHLTSAKLADSL